MKQVTTQTKNKRKRTIEIEVEEQDVERVEFWQEPLRFDENFELTRDSCLVPADQITMREMDEPSHVGFDEEFNNTFGDEGQGSPFGEDDEMDSLSFPEDSLYAFDENMNDVMVSDMDRDSTPYENGEPQQNGTMEVPNIIEKEPEPLKSLCDRLPPLNPSTIAELKMSKNRRSSSIFLDVETVVSRKIMEKRISNTFVNCQKRVSDQIQNKQPLQLIKKKPDEMFSVPVMNGLFNREMFIRNATIKPLDTDWSIIQDAFDDDDNLEHPNEHNGTSHQHASVEILRSESESRTGTRASMTSNRRITNMPSRTSTPLRTFSRQSICCSTPIPPIPIDLNGNELDLIVSPPFDLQQWNSDSKIIPSNPLAPPVNFGGNDQNNFELEISPIQPLPRNACTQNASKDDPNAFKLFEHPDLEKILGENSQESNIISKLIGLWQREIHPINVEHLLPLNCNRIHAAKTFSSLLYLKKKNLIQLENSADGKIVHIAKGTELKLNVN